MDSAPPSGAPKPKLLDRGRQALRVRHLSHNTEQAYIGWIKRFIFFQGKRHPAEMAEAEIGQFLSSLACDSHASLWAGLHLMECCRLRVKDIDFSPSRSILRSHKRIMLINVCPRRRVPENLDKSLETGKNCRSRWKFRTGICRSAAGPVGQTSGVCHGE
ncbi:MAG: phage integrase N-terminal SAM-like domain-containing protein [Candidatus Rokubacteria bacterium]|nr:phage integrase N-terminal SAM-like domain-containing protein [Candidatus Rokubacteria bacterium]